MVATPSSRLVRAASHMAASALPPVAGRPALTSLIAIFWASFSTFLASLAASFSALVSAFMAAFVASPARPRAISAPSLGPVSR